MEINVSKQEILKEVERRISLESSILPDKYDLLWVNTNKKELLEGFWIEGCESVISIFKRYLSDSTTEHSFTSYDTDSVFELKVEMPERYSNLLDGSVITAVKMIIACNVVFGWLNSVLPDLAVKYKEESTGYADDLRSKILYRNSPLKPLLPAKEDKESIQEAEDPFASAKSDNVDITQFWELKCKANFR